MKTPFFEELEYAHTAIGELILQRRRVAALGDRETYEVKLGDAYLMSSLFHDAEDALAERVLSRLNGEQWDVVVGGLGLGYTAAEALRRPEVRELVVVEALAPVIDWHERNLVPNGEFLTSDPRCRYQEGDFFAMAGGEGFDPARPGRQFDAVLLDIDHSPRHTLSPAHDDFYTVEGLRRLVRFLKPGGLFGLWSNDPPEDEFIDRMNGVFAKAEGLTIPFANPLTDGEESNGLYIGFNGRCGKEDMAEGDEFGRHQTPSR
ncbi:MAG: spermidine synthase [Kiritimatiellia bacterium]